MSRSKSNQAGGSRDELIIKTIETAHMAGSFIELHQAEYTQLFWGHMTPEQDKMVKGEGLSIIMSESDRENKSYSMLLQLDGKGRGKHYILGRLYKDGRAEPTIIEGLRLTQGSKIGLRLGPPVSNAQDVDIGLRLGPPIPDTRSTSNKKDLKIHIITTIE